jgi:polysaccharide pyruvyl transferase WcaK-like protein
VWVRDPESAAVLASFGVPGVRVAADTAILQGRTVTRSDGHTVTRLDGHTVTRSDGHTVTRSDGHTVEGAERQSVGLADRPKTLGLCISTQRRVADLEGVKRLVATVRAGGARVVGIPMNPKTDRPLLESLGVDCIRGTTPQAAIDAAAQCSVVLSSRLHLLILAANAGTPVLGIARGAKVANWLDNFGRTVEGGFADCDWKAATRHVLAALQNRGDWDDVRQQAYARLEQRFENARREFIAQLTLIPGV